MSYEGTEEYICEKGHHFAQDAMYEMYVAGGSPQECPQCKGKIKWRHSIDETNGINENDPGTLPAPIKEIGFEDAWKTDHYGNKYAIKIIQYAPDSSIWKEM